MKPVKVVVVLLLGVLLIAFLFQNYSSFLATTTLEFRLPGLFQFSSMPIPLYALILFSLFGGGVIAALYSGLVQFRLRSALRSLRRQNNSLQEELKSLRNLPITEAEVPASPSTEPESAEEAEKANSGVR
jgi:uncharacterized integral membrane protein